MATPQPQPWATDVLAAGEDRPRRTLPRWIWWAAAVAALLALAAFALDSWVRTAAVADLEARLDDAVAAVEAGERQVQAMVEYTGPQRTSASADPDLRASLDTIVQEAAVEAMVRVDAARADLVSITTLPWHGETAQARDRAVAWLDARASGLRSTADTGVTTYVDRTTIDTLRADLQAALAAL